MSARTNALDSDHVTFHGTDGSLVVDLGGATDRARPRRRRAASRSSIRDEDRAGWTAEIDFVARSAAGRPARSPTSPPALGYMAFLEAVQRSAAERLPHHHRGRDTVKVLEFARSTILFRIDLDVLPPRTLSHKPPFAMNNARIQIDSVCRITDRASGRVHTFVLGGDCKTERVGAERGPLPRSQRRLHPDLLRRHVHAHQDVRARGHAGRRPTRRGRASRATDSPRRSPRRSSTPTWTSSSARASCWRTGRAIVDAVLANDLIVGIHRLSTDRYDVEIEYPAKTINANERDIVYQTDTGPILWPDLKRDPADLLTGLELAFTAANAPDWAQIIVRRRTPIADGVEVYHYAELDPGRGHRQRVLPAPRRRPSDPPAGRPARRHA